MSSAIATDGFLSNIAKAFNGESFRIPAYLAIGTEVISSFEASSTSLPGEVGARIDIDGSRDVNTLTYTGTRSGTYVTNPAGEEIRSSGLFSYDTQGTTDDLFVGVIHAGLTQTTNFDIEFVYTVEITRRT